MSPDLCGVFCSVTRRSCRPHHRPLRGLENTAETRRDFVTERLILMDRKAATQHVAEWLLSNVLLRANHGPEFVDEFDRLACWT